MSCLRPRVALASHLLVPALLVAALLVAAATAATGPAAAQPVATGPVATEDRAAARALGKEGVALYHAGDYAGALDRLSRAHKIVGLTTTGLWRARCLAELGRLVEAAEQYFVVTRIKLDDRALDIHRSAVDEAYQRRQALLPRIPQVRLIAGDLPADGTVTIDGKPVPAALMDTRRPIDPGAHILVATRGDWRHEQRFSIAEGEVLDLRVEASPPPAAAAPQPPPPKVAVPPDEQDAEPTSSVLRPLGWTAIGIGGASLVAGAVTGLLALDRKSSLDEGCVNFDCPPATHDDVDAFEALRIASTVTIIVGGALAIAGVTLVVTAPSDDEPAAPSVSLRLAPVGAELMVGF